MVAFTVSGSQQEVYPGTAVDTRSLVGALSYHGCRAACSHVYLLFGSFSIRFRMKSFAVQKEHKGKNQSVLEMDISGSLRVVCSTTTTGPALHGRDSTLDMAPWTRYQHLGKREAKV